MWIPWRVRNENMILWNRAARGKSLLTQEQPEYTEKPGEMGVLGTEGALALSQHAYPLYLMTNECQRLSCLHPVKLWDWWQVQV